MCQGVSVLAVWAVVEVLGCHSREVVNVSDSYVRGRKDVRALAGFHITTKEWGSLYQSSVRLVTGASHRPSWPIVWTLERGDKHHIGGEGDQAGGGGGGGMCGSQDDSDY